MSTESFTSMIVRRLLGWMVNSLVEGVMKLLSRRRNRKAEPSSTTAEPPQRRARRAQRDRT